MSPAATETVYISAFGWVIGWGFILFAHPVIFFRLLGRANPTTRMIKLARIIGAVELIMVIVSALAYLAVNFVE